MNSCPPIELLVAPDRFIRIDEIERFLDGSGYVGRVSLQSGNFVLQNYKFYFDQLEQFAADMNRLYENLSGAAQLQEQFERNHISFAAISKGHVRVSGHFEHFDGESQRLEFGFTTDQTFLPAFIRSIERAVRETQLKR